MATRTSKDWEVCVDTDLYHLFARLWNKAAVYSSQRLATKYKAELDKAREDLRKSQSDYNLLRRQQVRVRNLMHVTPNISGMQGVEHSRRLHVWDFLQEETSLQRPEECREVLQV